MNRFSRILMVAGLATCTFGIVTFARAKGIRDNWEVINIKDSIVTFRNGERLNTNLYDVELLGRVSLKPGSPVFIFAGHNCHNCDERKAVFIFTPGEKEKKVIPEYAPFDYPGKEFDENDSSLLYESRMFVGNVLPNVPDGIIWYQTMLTDYGTYESSVYLIKIVKGKMYEQLEFDHLPAMADTLKLKEENKCREIAGEDYLSEDGE